MKIAVLYDSKYGNTKLLAEYLAEYIQAEGHEIQLFRTTETKPADLLAFQPAAILVGGPTHFGKPTRTLGKYVKKLGKVRASLSIHKAAVFNCNTGDDVCKNIKDQISTIFPQVEIMEQSLPIRTGATGDNWKEIDLQTNWKEEANTFLSAFLSYL